jgi:hypothetical protein
MKRAREIFSRKLLGKISDEEAHRIAESYLRAVKESFPLPNSRQLEKLLDVILEWDGFATPTARDQGELLLTSAWRCGYG